MGCRSFIEGSDRIEELFVRFVKPGLGHVEFCADADACLLDFSPSIRRRVKRSLLFLGGVFRCWDRGLGDCERLVQLGAPSDRLRALNLEHPSNVDLRLEWHAATPLVGAAQSDLPEDLRWVEFGFDQGVGQDFQ